MSECGAADRSLWLVASRRKLLRTAGTKTPRYKIENYTAAGILILVLLSLTPSYQTSGRHPFSPARRLWAKRYGLSVLAFFLFMGLGWLVGTGGTSSDYCRTAESSAQGNVLMLLAFIAGFAALISLLCFILSFLPKPNESYSSRTNR